MIRYVVGFALSQFASAVVLVRKERPAWQRGRLNGVGGKVESGETPDQAMRREFHEEAGVDVKDWQLFAILRGIDGAQDRKREGAIPAQFEVWFYRATLACGIVSLTDEAVSWYGLDVGVPPDALPNLHWLIPMASMRCSGDWPYIIREKDDPAGVEAGPT